MKGNFLIATLGLLAMPSVFAEAPFRALFPIEVGSQPRGVVVADFDGDGVADFASLDSVTKEIVVQRGNGMGGVLSTRRLGPFDHSVDAIVSGDLNGDGKIDLVVGTFANAGDDAVYPLIGRGDGTFVQGDRYPVGDGVTALTLFDADGDGWLDLAVANANSFNVMVLPGLGNGRFGTRTDYDVDGVAQAIAAADIDNDGIPDLVVSAFGNTLTTFCTLKGRGDGTFDSPVPHQYFAGITGEIAVADFDRDGNMDVAVAQSDHHISLFAGHGDGDFDEPTFIDTPIDFTAGITVADVDADGRPDLIVGLSGELAYYAGNGDGTFRAAGSFHGPNVGFDGPIAPAHMSVADIDNDGRLDIVAPDLGSFYLYVFLGDTLLSTSFE